MQTIDIKTVDLNKIFPKPYVLFEGGQQKILYDGNIYGLKKIVIVFNLWENTFDYAVYLDDKEIKRYNSISLAIKKYNSL